MLRFTVRDWRWVRGKFVEKVVGNQNVAELREILAQVLVKRSLKDAGLDVPEVWWQQLVLDGNASVEQGIPTDVFLALNAAIAHGTLEDIAADPHIARMRRRIGELKAPVVVEELRAQLEDSDEPIVVFAHHRSVLTILGDGLSEFGISYIDGDTSPIARDIAIERFQEGKARVFLGQNEACQFSLTLTRASRVVLVEPAWNADTNYQLGQRVARIGSTAQRCIGQLCVLAGTIDEAIVAQNARELKQAEALFH